MRSRLQLLLEVVADDHPSAPLLPGLRSIDLDEAHGDLVVFARACRSGALALLADGASPTPSALASIGVVIVEVVESLCRDADIEQVIGHDSRLGILGLAESIIGIAQLMAAPTGQAPSTMVAMMLASAESG